MKNNDIINSDLYWNGRFSDDWAVFDGPKQSRFFSNIAAKNLPRWFIDLMRRQSLTLADWGCAQGDGTDVWASYVDAKQIVGVDFSSVAVEQAALRYPAIRFVNEDWLLNSIEQCEMFDVVFSSNTLEHFHNPYDVLNVISCRAKKSVVLALPYREVDRIEEHFFSFLPENIPLRLENGFILISSQVVDCRKIPNTFWNGDQIVLIYAEINWLDSLKLTLSDCRISSSDDLTEIAHLNSVLDSLSIDFFNVNQEVVERDKKILDLENIVVKHARQVEEFHAERKNMIDISDWAKKISEQPIRFGMKKHARKLAVDIYRKLPLNPILKSRFKSAALKSFRFFSASNSKMDISENKKTNLKCISSKLVDLAQGGSISGRDIFVFSVIDWNFRIQRPQHLSRSFAKAGKRVFYFSSHFVDSATPGYELERIDPVLELYQVKLHVTGAPAIYFSPPAANALKMIELGVAQLMMDFFVISCASIVQHAYWYPMVLHLPNTLRVYDCMDYHEGFGSVPEKLIEIEKAMLRDSDLVVVTSVWLEDFARDYNRNIALIRNAGQYEHFSEQPDNIYRDVKKRKIIGYYGAIAEWFDLDLIRAIAIDQSDALILLIGNDTIEASKALKGLTNVVFTGEVPYSRLPFYLHAFDVCLLPFLVIPLTLATNPVKVYEYLAAGKPVVCVDLPEILQFGDLVNRAQTSQEFVQMVADCISIPSSESAYQLRRQFACEQTWDLRISDLSRFIEETCLPKVSVVVLTYNNLDLTRACVDSLLRWSDYPNLEIIVVDNASTDGTPAYLRQLHEENPKIKLLLNDRNLGFASGNNVGLEIATGEYLVMLNNDTVVTPGWVLTLLRHLQSDSSIGLVGPVTNNIGNQAKINITYNKPEEMLALSMEHTTMRMGQRIPIRTAAFFCVMMSSKVFKQIGLLDENFGRGFFEDDDYCRRAEKLGLSIVCAEDVFIHHHLSASFNKMGNGEKEKLFNNNKAYYESKWGKWISHEYRM
jgi:GT2 family glycosyltransferase/glycosyltransferase involved in cell wall biosynthesis